MMKRFIPLIAMCIIIGTLLACSGSDNTSTKTSTTDFFAEDLRAINPLLDLSILSFDLMFLSLLLSN